MCYMDGVFDLFHTGPNETDFRGDGDKNATSYKRPPIIGEVNRSVIVGGLKLVDEVICQSPLAWIRQVEKKMKSKRFGAGNCASHE